MLARGNLFCDVPEMTVHLFFAGFRINMPDSGIGSVHAYLDAGPGLRAAIVMAKIRLKRRGHNAVPILREAARASLPASATADFPRLAPRKASPSPSITAT